MNTDAELYDLLFKVTRGDLDTTVFSFPHLRTLVDKMTLIRIHRISEFWKKEKMDSVFPLTKSTSDLISGFYGLLSPWIFLLKGTPKGVECWYGASHETIDQLTLLSCLHASYPDVRCITDSNIGKSIYQLNNAVVLTGTPNVITDPKQNIIEDGIEKVCRGLSGTNWIYAVYGEPVPSAEVSRSLNDIADKIRNTHSTFLLKSSPTDEQNRVALRYIQLLETKLQRLEKGRTSGLWRCNVFLLCDNLSSLRLAKGLLYNAFSGENSLPDPIRIHSCQADQRSMPSIEPLTSMEVALLIRPPSEEYSGYEVVDYTRFGLETNLYVGKESKSINIGQIYDRGRNTSNEFKVPLEDFTKHGLIVGVTGSGKTNTCFSLLDGIWDEGRGVPFMVIESAKSEYRGLLKHSRFKGLKVFTVGDEVTSPFRINPFEAPKGILVQTHIDYLKSLFSASFVLYPPMPYVLEQSLQEIYEDRGWDLTGNKNSRGEESIRSYPSLSDLASKISVVVDRMGYDERITMDIKAGLVARINQLSTGGGKGLMFSTRQSLDVSTLFESPCILELKQIVSDDEKAFIMGLILIRLYEHYEGGNSKSLGKLCHITLIEEAHRLLRNVSTEQTSEITANPKGRAIEVFTNILSEIRAYGEGILIAEQIPVKLTPDAIKNTNLKIIHRLVAEDDRKVVGSTMNLSNQQLSYLATLRAGEGVAYTEGMQKPVLIKVPISATKASLKAVSTMEVKEAMRSFWLNHFNLLMPFPGCVNCPEVVGKRSCGIRKGYKFNDSLKESFISLFNILRLNKPLVLEAYSDFHSTLQRNNFNILPLPLSYCHLVELIDIEIGRRGDFYGWSYKLIEQASDLVCSIVFIISRNFGHVDTKVMEKEFSKDLTTFSNLFNRLSRIEIFPFTGCRFCTKPCHYLFDIQQLSNGFNTKYFHSTFINPEASMLEIARICLKIVTHAYFFKDLTSCRGAALCFAVKQFSDLELSPSNQVEMTNQLVEALKSI